MSLVKRLLHPHYVANVVLAATYPVYQLINHPEYFNNSSFAAYSRYLLPALAVLFIKVRGSQSAEELVGVVALYIKVYSLYGFWTINEERFTLGGISWSGWWRVSLYLLAWLGKSLCMLPLLLGLVLIHVFWKTSLTSSWFIKPHLAVFIALPQPPYQGPSKVISLNASQIEFLTNPTRSKKSKGKERADSSSELRNRASNARIVELDDNGDPLDSDDEVQEHHSGDHELNESELDPSHYWIIAFNTTWSSPCRYFEAVLARCSITYVFQQCFCLGSLDLIDLIDSNCN